MHLLTTLPRKFRTLKKIILFAVKTSTLVFLALSQNLSAQDIRPGSSVIERKTPKPTPTKRTATKPNTISEYKRKPRKRAPVRARTTRSVNYAELAKNCEEKDYQCKIINYTKAVETDPDDDESYFYRGVSYADTKKYREAIEDYTRVIATSPEVPSPYYMRGISYNKIGDHDAALRDFTKVIEMLPENAGGYRERAITYLQKNNLDAALADYNQAIKLDPKNSVDYSNRGYIYAQKKNEESAFRDYNKAVEVDPKYATAYKNRGNSYFRMGNFEAALKDYNKAMELSPDTADLYSARAAAYRRLGLASLAAADEKKSEELTAPVAPLPVGDDSAAITSLLKQFGAAYLSGDRQALAQMLPENFAWDGSAGKLTKQQVINASVAHPVLDYKIENFRILEQATGSVVVGYVDIITLRDGRTFGNRVTAELVQRNGRWQITSLKFAAL